MSFIHSFIPVSDTVRCCTGGSHASYYKIQYRPLSFPSYLRVSFLRVVAILKICVRSKYERTGIEFPSETVLVSYILVVRSRKFPRISETWPIQAPDRWLNENHSKWPPSPEKTQSTTKKIRLILSIFYLFYLCEGLPVQL